MARRVLSMAIVLLCTVFVVDTGSAQQGVYVVKSKKDQGWLGVMIQDITPRVKEKENLSVTSGALVTDVEEGSPADDAGIQEGDVIVKFNGKEIDDSNELTKAVHKAKPESDATVQVVRKGEHKELTVKVGKDRSPESFAYSFGNRGFAFTPKIPKMPRMGLNFRMFSQNEYYGMTVQELTKQLAEYFEVPGRHGVLVVEVQKGSDADKAGVKAGDVITKVNSSSVSDMSDLRDEFDQSDTKDVPMDVLRKGKAVNLKLHLSDEERGEDDDDAMLMDLPSGCTIDHSAHAVQSRIFSRDFLHQVMVSIHELKDRLFHRIEDYTQKIRTVVEHLEGNHAPGKITVRQS